MAIPETRLIGLGYLHSMAIEPFVFIGGAMVTDTRGLPVEFRYTEPVRANRLQRLLYGEALERYVHKDVIIDSLTSRLESKPAVLVVGDSQYAGLAVSSGLQTIWLGETRLPRLTAAGDIQETAADEFLLQLAGASSPTRVKGSDASVGAARKELSEILVRLSQTMDLLEPLRRIEAAIGLLWEESDENPLQPIVDARR